MLPSRIKNLFNRNRLFHNIHLGKRCFILCTGPSINKQDLKPLRNEICIAVSEFYLHPDVSTISPAYHVLAPHHAPYNFDIVRKTFEAFHKYYPNEVKIFLGYNPYKYSYLNFLMNHPEFNNDNNYFLNYSYASGLDESNYSKDDLWDITKRLFGIRTAVYSAVQIAAYMGFSEIYLLGCDHDHLSDVNRGRSTHFFPDSKGETDDRNEWPSTEQLLYALYLRWRQYRLMQEYLEKKKQRIFNATAGGMLDVFPRVDLKRLMENQ
jgi:hypothetical protein